MVMTDIGDAANATDDGAFLLINDFSAKLMRFQMGIS
jgi:hypothetical protein